VWVCAPADVALGMRRDHDDLGAAFDALVDRSAPGLAARLTDRTSPVRASMRLPNQFRSAWGRGWALVGDAGYHRDPVTGQGISDAFTHAELLADAVDQVLRGECDEATAMAAYQSARDASVRETFELTCALAAFPPVAQFVALQKQLGQAIDTRAMALASRPRRRPANLAA
jgi:2-polyprenyl-6-methoxyphenol hydroxylase-like FAD-dependent oxidoreductase